MPVFSKPLNPNRFGCGSVRACRNTALLMFALSGSNILAATADIVILDGGEKLIGTVVEEKPDTVTFESHSIGRVTIPRDHIQKIEREQVHAAPAKTEPFSPPAPPTKPGENSNPDKGRTESDGQASHQPWWRPGLLKSKQGADWIQLTSGEWLRGRLNGMDDFTVDFESDKLHELTIDWKDVLRIHAPQAVVSYGDRQHAEGTLDLEPESAIIRGAGELKIPREQLYRISPGLPREIDNWRAKFNLGLNVRSGNTNQTNVVTGARIERRTSTTNFLLNYNGNFSTLDGEVNTDNQRLNLSFDISLTRRLFLRLPLTEYFRDPFQNVAHRFTIGGGVGYEIYDSVWTRWLVIAGPAFQNTWFESVQAGEPTESSTPAFALQTSYEKYLTEHVDLELIYQGIVTSEEAGRMTHHTSTALSIHLTRSLDLDLQFIWDRTENPQIGADGIQPKKDDLRLNLSMGVEL